MLRTELRGYAAMMQTSFSYDGTPRFVYLYALIASHCTGKERDTESGLDYFGARYFGSTMGRFMSPDPLGGHLADPQTLNKYVYARNNPLIYVDPDGLDFNLRCSGGNTATCQNGLQGTTATDANGKSSFTATVISNDKNGNLVDQAGNQYSGTVTSNGVSFSQNGSNTSSAGSWINGSNATSFTQSSGALNGFSFNFTQPNTATGQTLAGTFSFKGDIGRAETSLENAGFSHSMVDQMLNPLHGIGDHYRGGGDPNTGEGSAHFIMSMGEWLPGGGSWRPPTSVNGEFHYGETDPRSINGFYNHVTREVLPYLLQKTVPH